MQGADASSERIGTKDRMNGE